MSFINMNEATVSLVISFEDSVSLVSSIEETVLFVCINKTYVPLAI